MNQLVIQPACFLPVFHSAKAHWLFAFLLVTALHGLVFIPLVETEPDIHDVSQMNAIPVVISAVVAAQINESHAELEKHQANQLLNQEVHAAPQSSQTSMLNLPEHDQGEIRARAENNTKTETTENTDGEDLETNVKDIESSTPTENQSEELEVQEQAIQQQQIDESPLDNENEAVESLELEQANDAIEVAEQMTAPEMTYSAEQVAAAQASWQSRLMSYLANAKKYPRMSKKKKEQGTVVVHFTMNRLGEVISVNIKQATPFKALNQEALDLIKRASPLPEPPEEFSGEEIQLAVPIEFYIY